MLNMAAETLQEAHKRWGWYLVLGVAMIVLGVYALIYGSAATLASIVVLGAVLIIAGIVRLVTAFETRNAGHVVLLLLVGALDIVVGWMLIQHAAEGALFVTALLAVLFVFEGFYAFVAALWLQFPNYGWVAFSGIVSLVLGILLWTSWPVSAAWFIGFAVGVNLIFAGASWSTLAFKLKAIAA